MFIRYKPLGPHDPPYSVRRRAVLEPTGEMLSMIVKLYREENLTQTQIATRFAHLGYTPEIIGRALRNAGVSKHRRLTPADRAAIALSKQLEPNRPQSEIAKLYGVSVSTVNKILKGSPRCKRINKPGNTHV